MDTGLKKSKTQYGTDSTAIKIILKEKKLWNWRSVIWSCKKKPKSFEENNKVQDCLQAGDIKKTVDQPMSSQHWKVFLRSDCGSMVSFEASKYNAMKKKISGLNRGQQQFCNTLTAMTENGDHDREEAKKAKIKAVWAPLTSYSSASKVSTFSYSTERGIKCLKTRKAILHELSEKTFQTD